MKKKKLLILMMSIGLLSPVIVESATIPTVVQAKQTKRQKMRKFVRSTLSQNNVRGSAVVIKNGVPQQISLGYGWYGKKIGNGNSKVVYPICSLQKVITGAMIVQLINETKHTKQKFNQNTKISRWYPNLKNADQITVGNLLTHTSGIKAGNTETPRNQNYSESAAINWAIDNANASASGNIGTFSYNNTNYILLAGIISQITGKSYASNLKERIVYKLGLTHTYLYPDIPKGKTDPISYNYDAVNKKNYTNAYYVKRDLASQIPGAGNLFSTPMDYYKIQIGLTNGSILSKADFNYLTHLKSKNSDYSGGVYLRNNDSLKTAYGNLNTTHFSNWFQMTTDNQNGLILFLNQSNDDEQTTKNIAFQILNHIKPNTFVNN